MFGSFKKVIHTFTDIHGDQVRINLNSICYYYEQGTMIHIYTNAGPITIIDLSIDALDNILLERL